MSVRSPEVEVTADRLNQTGIEPTGAPHPTPGSDRLRPARLRPIDLLRVGFVGMRTRPLRAVLSALGIAIGVAAMVAVVGISSSSREDLNRFLDGLGTNLLTATPGQDLFGKPATMPADAVAMVRRIGPVEDASSVGAVTAKVYRNDHIPKAESGGIGVYAADLGLLDTLRGTVAQGHWLTEATSRYPVAVLGSKAAQRLGLTTPRDDVVVLVGGKWFTVGGILDPVALAPELDAAVLIGQGVAANDFAWDGLATTIYARAAPNAVEEVRSVLGRSANPQAPNEVKVSRPSDALAAKNATDRAFTGLLLGLGAVALLVGGIGVANTMIISVLERRAEIGLRRSLGATRANVRAQFLVESVALSLLGGLAGCVLGYAVTTVYAGMQGWPVAVPLAVIGGGIAVTLTTGAIAGLYPAVRASRLSPTEALSAA